MPIGSNREVGTAAGILLQRPCSVRNSEQPVGVDTAGELQGTWGFRLQTGQSAMCKRSNTPTLTLQEEVR